jgi:chromosome segregation ATPase
MQSELRRAREQNAQTEFERDKLAGQLAESQQLAACLESELREEEEQNKSLRASVEALRIELDAANARFKQVNHDWMLLSSTLAADKQALTKDVEQLTSALLEAEKRAEDAIRELTQLQAEASADRKRLGRELDDHKQRAQSALHELQQMQKAADVLYEEAITRAYEMELMAQKLLLASKANTDSRPNSRKVELLRSDNAAADHEAVAAEYMARLAALRAQPAEDRSNLIVLRANEIGVADMATATPEQVDPHAADWDRRRSLGMGEIDGEIESDARLEQARARQEQARVLGARAPHCIRRSLAVGCRKHSEATCPESSPLGCASVNCAGTMTGSLELPPRG